MMFMLKFDQKKVLEIARHFYNETPKITPTHGESNYVFRLKFKKFERFIKIEGPGDGKDWKIEKEMFIFNLARKVGVPVPEVEFHNFEGKFIRQHWMIMKNVGNTNLDELFGKGKDTRKLHTEAGKILAKIHKIHLKKQGMILADKIEPRQFSSFKKASFNKNLSILLKKGIVSKEEADSARKIMKSFKDSKRSMLCHNDFAGCQVITDGKKVGGIIDWEWAEAGEPISDFAKAELAMRLWSGNGECFRKGYESITKLPKDYETRKKPYQLVALANMLVFFKNRKESRDKVKRIFLEIIQGNIGRITLRKPKMSDAKEFREIFNDKEVSKQISGYEFPFTLNNANAKLKEIISLNKSGKHYEFAIEYDNEFAGLICLENPSEDRKTFELGYAIGRKHWNKGIASKAVEKMIKFGFDKLKLKRIVADNDESNPASARILEKNGFRPLKKAKIKRENRKAKVIYWEVKR